jgi:Ca2+-binding EF-hand superfamily protein
MNKNEFVEAIRFLPEILSKSSTSNVCPSADTMSQFSLVSFAQFSLVSSVFQRQRMLVSKIENICKETEIL